MIGNVTLVITEPSFPHGKTALPAGQVLLDDSLGKGEVREGMNVHVVESFLTLHGIDRYIFLMKESCSLIGFP